MTNRYITARAMDFQALKSIREAGKALPFQPTGLHHVYIKLDLESRFENANNAKDAKLFLRSVARAAMATIKIAKQYDGELLEVQGSTIHTCLPFENNLPNPKIREFVSMLHTALRAIFDDRSRVNGWRMSIDSGKTLIVAGRGAHGDDSWVSLGRAANRPAKHLYAQLALPEDRRSLKKFHAAFFGDRLTHVNLDQLPMELGELRVMVVESARTKNPTLRYFDALKPQGGLQGSVGTPTADKPETHFGWVMRADLDGFTSRVEECFDNDEKLGDLASEFYQIMDAAASFVEEHYEVLAQMPWAGDNFTAAALFHKQTEYDEAARDRLVELSLDFENDMSELADQIGFAGWAHGTAGGSVHGNSGGNVFIAGIDIEGRRFLVGAGEGFGRSIQAFTDINPDPDLHVIYMDDWERLKDEYKTAFSSATNTDHQVSTLFKQAIFDDLRRVRADLEVIGVQTVVTLPNARRKSIKPKPHFK